MEKIKNSKLLVICYWVSRVAYFVSWFGISLLSLLLVFKLLGLNFLSEIKLDLPLSLSHSTPIEMLDFPITEADLEYDTVQLSIPAHAIPTSWFALLVSVVLVWIFTYNRLILSLSKILARVRKAEIFCPANSKGLKLIGLLLIGTALFGAIVMSIYAHVFIAGIESSSFPLDLHPTFHLEGLFPGLLVYLLGLIFQYGHELKQEQDLTV